MAMNPTHTKVSKQNSASTVPIMMNKTIKNTAKSIPGGKRHAKLGIK